VALTLSAANEVLSTATCTSRATQLHPCHCTTCILSSNWRTASKLPKVKDHHHHPRISSRRKSWNNTSGPLCVTYYTTAV